MLILIDTNVLLRIAEPGHSSHKLAARVVDELDAGNHHLVVVPQNLYEFWAVATRTVQANGLGHSTDNASALIGRICGLFRLLRDERTIYESWLTLVEQHRITGVNSYDARLVAAMQRHGVAHILTFNGRDFRRYPNITVMDPHDVVAETTDLEI
jgi:predicted nucleic acid-binding protein